MICSRLQSAIASGLAHKDFEGGYGVISAAPIFLIADIDGLEHDSHKSDAAIDKPEMRWRCH